jgi:hypothetical protein
VLVVSFALAACAEQPFAPDDACVTTQCADVSLADKPPPPDESVDAGSDTAPFDSAADTGTDVPMDAAPNDDATFDANADVAITDASFDAPFDVFADVRPVDVRDVVTDTGVDARPDTPALVDRPTTGGCVSGATGTHVVRFRWTGSGPNTRASVSYEANTLPDTSRWRVTANSMSIGYSPVFTDTFLGVGGLELSGTVFIDVELSTAGLAGLSNVTLAVFGRSFNTTASGSFTWQTFAGTGAAPSGLVANSAPYEWYRANATAAFMAGDGRVLLRIRSGPPSGALVVNRVEVCFNAR